MNDLKVSTAARAAGISESTVFLLENGSAALLTAGEVARISGKLAGQSAGDMREEFQKWLDKSGGGTLESAFAAGQAARQSAGQERGEAVAWVEFGGRGRLGEPLETKVHIGRDKPGTMPAAVPLYAAPTDAQSRIAELEAQLRAVADNHEAAISALEDTMREVCGDNASLRAERDKYYQQVINVGAVAINSIPQEHYDNLQQQLTESREREGRMRAFIERAYDEHAFSSRDWLDAAADELTGQAALAADKEQK